MGDATLRAEDRVAALAGIRADRIETAGGAIVVAYLGSETPRERIWIQMDALVDDTASALASWAAVNSLISDHVAKYRVPVLSRASVAVAMGERRLGAAPRRDVPVLDAGLLGTSPGVLRTMARFGATLLIHVQDWTGEDSGSLALRMVESFKIRPDVHKALPPMGRGRRLSRSRRAHDAVSAAPDWLVGTGLTRYLRLVGYPLSAAGESFGRDPVNNGHTVHALAPGRFVPTLPFRRLGGGNLAELALMACGTHGITAQVRGGSALERAAASLAVAEAAIVSRMGLAVPEVSS